MQIVDLEKLLNSNSILEFPEIENAILRFGHGYCHDLTFSLNEIYHFKMIAIVSKSGLPIHSCVLIADNLTLDAYGINTIKTTLNRYNKICLDNIEEEAEIKYINEEYIANFALLLDEPEDVINDFQPILNYLNLNLNSLVKS